MANFNVTRRQMLRNSAGVIAGLSLGGCCCQGILSSQCKRTSGGFKIGVFDTYLGKAADPRSVKKAREFGIEGLQVDMGRTDPPSLLDREVQRRYMELSKEHDVEIASLALGVLNTVPYKSDPRAERWVSQSIDACEAMGVEVVLLAFFVKGELCWDKQGVDAVVEKLKRVAPKAESAGVILGLESMLSGEQHMDIIERVGSPAVKVYYDVANSNSKGYNIYDEIRMLGSNICQFHAKDNSGLFGKGDIDFQRVREAMDDIDYRGWLVIEAGAIPTGAEESLRANLEYLRKIFPAG